MAPKSESSSNAKPQGFLKKRAATFAMLLIWPLRSALSWAILSVLASLVFLLFVLPDLIQRQFRRQSKTLEPTTRKLPIPIRDGSTIYAVMPDNSRVEVTPLAASTHAQLWFEVVAGAMVYEKTKTTPPQ